MTSSRSAAATALPDRRHFLSTIAGAGALSLPVLPAMAWAPGPIEAMWPDYLRLRAEDHAADARAVEVDERYQPSPRPLWHPHFDVGDFDIIKSDERRVLEEGGYEITDVCDHPLMAVCDCGIGNIAQLKALIAKANEPSAAPAVRDKHAVIARRAEKTLDKIEAWGAEEERLRGLAGLTLAETDSERAAGARQARSRAMLAIEATTFRELAFQAAILDVEWDKEEASRALERLIELAGVTPGMAA